MRLVIYKHLIIDKDRPLVFLDMDGVVNGGYQHEHYDTLYRDEILTRPSHRGDYALRSLAVPLMRLLSDHRVQLVLVSSWFDHMIDASHPQVDEFRAMFGLTPLGSLDTQGGEARGRAVGQCIAATKHRQAIVIDDCNHFYTDDRIPKHHIVAPSGRYGMQACDMESLSRLLTA